eukprot:TRINITY_DN84735_c0_g1_i1.p1 TRINITY_DN84735_c0_g1~~TRINITY_DN84735_c0_g1_i1.p1  ORF type:complete len:663 (-),score=76.12 TRINITY_DN84735_c0_g1_i1:152-2074(-)
MPEPRHSSGHTYMGSVVGPPVAQGSGTSLGNWNGPYARRHDSSQRLHLDATATASPRRRTVSPNSLPQGLQAATHDTRISSPDKYRAAYQRSGSAERRIPMSGNLPYRRSLSPPGAALPSALPYSSPLLPSRERQNEMKTAMYDAMVPWRVEVAAAAASPPLGGRMSPSQRYRNSPGFVPATSNALTDYYSAPSPTSGSLRVSGPVPHAHRPLESSQVHRAPGSATIPESGVSRVQSLEQELRGVKGDLQQLVAQRDFAADLEVRQGQLHEELLTLQTSQRDLGNLEAMAQDAERCGRELATTCQELWKDGHGERLFPQDKRRAERLDAMENQLRQLLPLEQCLPRAAQELEQAEAKERRCSAELALSELYMQEAVVKTRVAADEMTAADDERDTLRQELRLAQEELRQYQSSSPDEEARPGQALGRRHLPPEVVGSAEDRTPSQPSSHGSCRRARSVPLSPIRDLVHTDEANRRGGRRTGGTGQDDDVHAAVVSALRDELGAMGDALERFEALARWEISTSESLEGELAMALSELSAQRQSSPAPRRHISPDRRHEPEDTTCAEEDETLAEPDWVLQDRLESPLPFFETPPPFEGSHVASSSTANWPAAVWPDAATSPTNAANKVPRELAYSTRNPWLN